MWLSKEGWGAGGAGGGVLAHIKAPVLVEIRYISSSEYTGGATTTVKASMRQCHCPQALPPPPRPVAHPPDRTPAPCEATAELLVPADQTGFF